MDAAPSPPGPGFGDGAHPGASLGGLHGHPEFPPGTPGPTWAVAGRPRSHKAAPSANARAARPAPRAKPTCQDGHRERGRDGAGIGTGMGAEPGRAPGVRAAGTDQCRGRAKRPHPSCLGGHAGLGGSRACANAAEVGGTRVCELGGPQPSRSLLPVIPAELRANFGAGTSGFGVAPLLPAASVLPGRRGRRRRFGGACPALPSKSPLHARPSTPTGGSCAPPAPPAPPSSPPRPSCRGSNPPNAAPTRRRQNGPGWHRAPVRGTRPREQPQSQ